ncbi:MAG: helix-turn-helix transcriptional regulator [Alphaproteobacteria bacterium]|nr:helix-turn-helix transcriptional regulator [Alphaproteobacteria bacterium]
MKPLRSVSKIEYDEAYTRQLDIHIGSLIKRLRIKAGITQSTLSKGTGVSLPQIQKYENATNRVSASRLIGLPVR